MDQFRTQGTTSVALEKRFDGIEYTLFWNESLGLCVELMHTSTGLFRFSHGAQMAVRASTVEGIRNKSGVRNTPGRNTPASGRVGTSSRVPPGGTGASARTNSTGSKGSGQVSGGRGTPLPVVVPEADDGDVHTVYSDGTVEKARALRAGELVNEMYRILAGGEPVPYPPPAHEFDDAGVRSFDSHNSRLDVELVDSFPESSGGRHTITQGGGRHTQAASFERWEAPSSAWLAGHASSGGQGGQASGFQRLEISSRSGTREEGSVRTVMFNAEEKQVCWCLLLLCLCSFAFLSLLFERCPS